MKRENIKLVALVACEPIDLGDQRKVKSIVEIDKMIWGKKHVLK